MTDDSGRRKTGRFIAILAAAVLGIAVVAALTHKPAIERALAHLAGRLMSSAGRTVTVENLRLAWPLAVTVGQIELGDGRGAWLRIRDLRMAVSPQSLLAGRLAVTDLSAKDIAVLRPPRAAPNAAPANPLDWLAAFPGGLRLGHVNLPVTLAAPVLGRPTRLAVTGTETRNAVFSLHVAADDGSRLSLIGRATGRALDLSWGVHVPDPTPWAALAGVTASGRLDAQGTIAGTARAPTITARALAGPGRAGPGSWRGMGLEARMVRRNGRWTTTARLEVLRPGWHGAGFGGDTLFADLAAVIDSDAGRITLGRVGVTDGAADLVLSGVMAKWGRDSRLSGHLQVKDLGRLVGRKVTGGAVVDLVLTGDVPAGRLRLAMAGRTEGLVTGNGAIDRLLGRQPGVHAVLAVAPGKPVRLVSGRISAAGGTVDAAGDVTPRLSLRGDIDLPTVSWVGHGLSGRVRIAGHLIGSIENPSFQGGAAVTDVTAMGAPPLSGRIGIATAGGLRLDPIALTAKGTRITGALTLRNGGIQGRLVLDAARLADWAKVIGTQASGAIHMTARLDPARGQTVRLEGSADALAIAGIHAGKVSVRAEASRLTTAPRFRIDAKGRGASLAASGSVALQKEGGSVDLDHLSVQAGSDRMGLIHRTRLVWGPKTIVASPLSVMVDGGRIDAQGGLRDGRLAVRARMKAVPLSLVALLAPDMALRGAVDGSATIGGTVAQPDGRMIVSGRDLGWGGTGGALVSGIGAKANVAVSRGRVNADIEARGGDRLRATARLSVPWVWNGAAPIAGRLRMTGDMGALSAALPLNGTALLGRLQADVTMGGTVAAPVWSGRAAITDGRIDHFATGTLLSKVAATAVLAGNTVTVTGTGGDGGKGRVAFDGRAALSGAYDAKAVLTEFRVLSTGEGEATASGTLSVAGSGQGGHLSGALVVDRAELDISRLAGGGPPTLDVIEVDGKGRPIAPAPKTSPAPASAGPSLPMALDVGVAIHHAYVRGRGLESEWRGAVKATGTLEKPVLSGSLNPVRGRYDLFGRIFTLSPASSVTFAGGPAIDPLLDVSAQAQAQDIVATVQVGGSADHPSVGFTSTPPLPKEEILARLLFGKDVGTLTSFQQLQLAQMAAVGLGLGGNGGFDPLGDLRTLLGLDMLEVGGGQGGSAGGPTLSLGKYIGPDTFVRVEQGVQGVGRVMLEENVGHGLSVTTGIGDQSGGSVGFTWKQDY